MDTNEILNQLNNPSFKVDLTKMLFKTYQLTLLNNEYLRTLLKMQLELRELIKGKTPSEFDDYLIDKFEDLEREIVEFVNQKIPDDVNDFSPEND